MTDAVPSSTATGAATAKAVATPSTAEIEKLRKVGKQFEAVFLRQMIGSMRQASPGDGLFDSSATDQFRDMGDSKMADQMASKGALGIADLLVKQYGARLSPGANTVTTPMPAMAPAPKDDAK